ncbi:ribonucleases P/MRP protein subunit POP1 [Cylas formicarius]|uniref:ribonucleases P/MRP protein subunit POP1 n=1 Tax=Cylas formicarius TaxID=197179 RepID=UPI002958BAB7|nr:ribonucleases P/MRP protein subunit POP1 [Cylas formicarius]
MLGKHERGPRNVQLPPSVTVSAFTAARVKEIQAMTKALKQDTGTKLVFQRLPRHMRRRAMSHNVKRLPRRLREIYARQMKKGGLPPKQKRPSRKFRRRPQDLVEEYARRKRRVSWLWTHIWHAKRFRMVEKWGYKLPWCPCDKSFRACYRATAKHCLIQDVSYCRCVQVSGARDFILQGLKKITDPSCGLTPAAKCYWGGKRGGTVTLFGVIGKAIGPVEFLWNSAMTGLWLFVHPAYYDTVLGTLEVCFRAPGDLEELHQELSVFRLTGPLSHAVLRNALQLPDWSVADPTLPEWVEKCPREYLIEQNRAWGSLRGPGQLSPGAALALVVKDPRYGIPAKRTKSQAETGGDAENFHPWAEDLGRSALWDASTRAYLRDNKVPNGAVADARGKLLTPGTEIANSGQLVPVVLVQRPGVRSGPNTGYAAGWDIILPSSYAQAFWLAFIMRGARAGGLRETRSIDFEMSRSGRLRPDTLAGAAEDRDDFAAGRAKFFRLPPNKRTNFNKYAIASPLGFRWDLLVDEWRRAGETAGDFAVLRDRNVLRGVQDYLDAKAELPSRLASLLIPVEVTPSKKGSCRKYSIICVPKPTDHGGDPVEPACRDVNAATRTRLRAEHKALLGRLGRRRKRARRGGKEVAPPDAEALEKYTAEMRGLWLPDATTVRASCSRQVAGFVTHGDFSFATGGAKGVGYVAAGALCELGAPPHRRRVLVRNTNSRLYRWASIRVICE